MSTPLPDFERYQSALLMWAKCRLPGWLRGKLDPADLVQQTLLEACRVGEKLVDRPDHEVLAYLRRALTNNMTDAIREFEHHRAELSPAAYMESSMRLADFLEADQSSPSERVQRNERYEKLAEAMNDLPDQQRVAVELRYLQGLKVIEIAKILDRSEGAVSLLLHRAFIALRGVLSPESEV